MTIPAWAQELIQDGMFWATTAGAIAASAAAIAAARQLGENFESQRYAKQSETVADFLAEVRPHLDIAPSAFRESFHGAD